MQLYKAIALFWFLTILVLVYFCQEGILSKTGLCDDSSPTNGSLLCQEYVKLVNSSLLRACLPNDKRKLTCKGRCGKSSERKSQETFCYCDSKCSSIGDCCVDYSLWCNTSNRSDYDCLTNKKSAFYGYVVKSGCPVTWPNNSVKELCFNRTVNDPRTIIPVFDFETRSTFANVFCAACNRARNYTFLKIRSVLKEIEDVVNESLPRYNLSYHTKNKIQWWIESNRSSLGEFCIPTTAFQGSTTITNNNLWSLCKAYAMPVYRSTDSKKFKNPHCGQFLSVTPNVSFRCSNLVAMEKLNIVDVREPLVSITEMFEVQKVIKIVEGPITMAPYVKTKFVASDEKPITLIDPVIKKTIEFNHSTVCEQQFIYSSKKHTIYRKLIVLAPSKKPAYERYSNIKYLILKCGNSTFEFLSSDDTISSIITITGFAISIPSLLFFLLTHILFHELRTLHGKNLISLSCAILAFQSFFLASGKTRVTIVCDIITGLLHYTLLAMFAWMSVVGYDVTMTFASKSTVSRRTKNQELKKKTRRFLWYSLYSWGSSLIVVVLGITLDVSKAVEMGYGSNNNKMCFLSLHGRIYLVAIPIGVVLLFNITTLVRTVVAIGNVQKDTKNFVQRKKQVSLSIVCVKLTTVMGITWLLFFVYSATGNLIVEYLANIVNSLQGFFMVLFFGYTKRIRHLYRKRFNCIKGNRNDSQNTSHVKNQSKVTEQSSC